MVEERLKNVPETRNSDITLMLSIWRCYFPTRIRTGNTGEEGVWLKDLYELPREDNVKRIRAKFNANGQYLPTEWEIAKARGVAEEEWREHLGYPPKVPDEPTIIHPYPND